MVLALATVVIVTIALIAVCGMPTRHDCTDEHHGKGSFSASCFRHVE